MSKLALIIVLSIVLFSCKKEETLAVIGVTEVEIIFTNPTQNETVSSTETLSIDGRIEANALMSGWRCTISNVTSGEILDEYEEACEQTLIMIHHHWQPTVQSGTSIQIKVEALVQSGEALAENSIVVTVD